MKKTILAVLAAMACTGANAGGYLTNTNLSAAFLRNPSRDAVIAIDGLYSNPAGVMFLEPGFHFQFNWQSAFQTRTVESTFGPFAAGINNNMNATKKFKGEAQAPVIPSFHMAYNWDKWSLNFSFGLVGGGGKCEFDKGLGSFEANAGLLPLLPNINSSLDIKGYGLDSYMRGRQYYFGGQIGGNYKVNDNLAVFVGARVVYATTNYFGYVKNISVMHADNTVDIASQYFGGLRDQAIGGATQAQAAAEQYAGLGMADQAALYQQMALGYKDAATTAGTLAVATQDIQLNCDQDGWGVTPIIGIDWKINDKWNIAAKYEFMTRMSLKNESVNSESADNLAALDQFKNGKSVREDIPAILFAGAQYSPIDPLRLSAGFHYYWDKDAKKYGNTQRNLDGNTWEINAGVEYDFAKNWTASAGWQTTNYGNTDAYMKDLSFITNSNSIGLGVSWKVGKKVTLDAGYFVTLYKHYEKTSDDYNNVSGVIVRAKDEATAQAIVGTGALKGTDDFHRTNQVFGIGVTLDF